MRDWHISALAAVACHAVLLFGLQVNLHEAKPLAHVDTVEVSLVAAPVAEAQPVAATPAPPVPAVLASVPPPSTPEVAEPMPEPEPLPVEPAPVVKTPDPVMPVPKAEPPKPRKKKEAEPEPKPTGPVAESAPVAAAAPPMAAAATGAQASTKTVGDGSAPMPGPDATTQDAPVGARAEPDYAKSPQPEYPLVARRRNQQGVVLLSVSVTAQGRAAMVAVMKSSGFLALDEAAVGAVRGWEFKPARVGGVPIASDIEVPVRFKLSN